MTIKLNTSICCIINVGMYESIISPQNVFEEDENKVKFSDALTEEEKEYFDEKHFGDWNSKAYKDLVSKYAMEIIARYFESISNTIKIVLRNKGEIISPKYYNYRSDILDFEVEVEQVEISKILSNVLKDEMFFKWAERYRSFPGFISWMPYSKEEYIEAIQGKDVERALGMYLTYLYDAQNNFKEHEFGHTYDLYDSISSSHGITEFINNERAVEIYNKASAGAV